MMKVFYELPNIENSVITIGSFDGLHEGHQHLILETKKIAATLNLDEYIISFEPHPRLVLKNNQDFRLLTTLVEKIEILNQLNVKNLILLPFSIDLSQKTAEEFILDFIIKPLKPKAVVLGYDHKFGKDRKGSKETFEIIKKRLNLDFELIEIQELKSENDKLSSTSIRNAIQKGSIIEANQLLGYSYNITGKVIEGRKLGRTIGFPTANIQLKDFNKLVPKTGVYQTRIKIEDKLYPAATNIGLNPTIQDDLPLTIESYILDFDEDIYGNDITLYFERYIRDEQKFETLEELKSAISADVSSIRSLL